MPLYMDHHRKLFDHSPVVFDTIRQRDLATKDKYGVRYVGFWVDEADGHMFCLVEAPNKEAIISMHMEAHNQVPLEIFEVKDRNAG